MVYILSAFLAELITALAYVTVFRGWLVVAPVTAVATATALLIYGRLLGRLGWKMGRLYVPKEKRIKKARPQARAALPPEALIEPSEPLGPEELDAEWEITPYGQKRRRVKGYGMTRDAIAESSPSEKTDSESEVTSYGQKRRRTKSYGITQNPVPPSDAAPEDGVTSLSVPPPASITDRPPASEPTDFERVIRANRRRLVESKPSFLGGVFSFPWYRQSRKPWLLLSMGFLVVYGVGCVTASLYLAIYKGR